MRLIREWKLSKRPGSPSVQLAHTVWALLKPFVKHLQSLEPQQHLPSQTPPTLEREITQDTISAALPLHSDRTHTLQTVHSRCARTALDRNVQSRTKHSGRHMMIVAASHEIANCCAGETQSTTSFVLEGHLPQSAIASVRTQHKSRSTYNYQHPQLCLRAGALLVASWLELT